MSTIREQILVALHNVAKTVTDIDDASITRERVSPLMEIECPALDLSPESEAAPVAVGAGYDRHDLTVLFKFYTAGSMAYSLADGYINDLHNKLYADTTLKGLVSAIIPGATEFAREKADQTIAKSTATYTVVYSAKREDLSSY